MPKVTIEFNIPEEQEELSITLNARKLYSALWDISQELRRLDKYGEWKSETKTVLQDLRRFFSDQTEGLLEQ